MATKKKKKIVRDKTFHHNHVLSCSFQAHLLLYICASNSSDNDGASKVSGVGNCIASVANSSANGHNNDDVDV